MLGKNIRKLVLLVSALALFATACGGASPEQAAATEEAEANQSSLILGGDIASSGQLAVAGGEITSLGDVVTGDRAVLAWYWAPH